MLLQSDKLNPKIKQKPTKFTITNSIDLKINPNMLLQKEKL